LLNVTEFYCLYNITSNLTEVLSNESVCEFGCGEGKCLGPECIEDSECDDGISCTDDVCNVNGNCENNLNDSNCDNGLFCDGAETCDAVLDCQAGTSLDCSLENVLVNDCLYNPDNIDFTYDFYSFVSVCDEDLDSCGQVSSGWESLITHDCNITCGASCIGGDCDDNTCSVSYEDYCDDDNKLFDYDGDRIMDSLIVSDSCENTCQSDCGCSDCSVDCSSLLITSSCVQGLCNAECDLLNPCSDKDCSYLSDCVGNDWYEYNDVLRSCLDNCVCDDPVCNDFTISYDASVCLDCQTDPDCDNLDRDYCTGDLIMHDEGICNDTFDCEVQTTTTKDCNDDDVDVCDDLNLNNYDYTCNNAVCELDSISLIEDCNDGFTCTIDSCDVDSGCGSIPDDGSCDDEEVCTDDSCIGLGGDLITGCDYDFNTASCEDGDLCTENDVCSGGSCSSGTAKDCTSFDDDCNVGVCNIFGNCEKDFTPFEGLGCDDFVDCTQPDICVLGVCDGTPDDSLCESWESCNKISDCQQVTCSDCEECDTWLPLDCDYIECHEGCNWENDCYYKGIIGESCIDLADACVSMGGSLVDECSDYHELECLDNNCNVAPSANGCILDNGNCVDAPYCGDGVPDLGENCVNCPADVICSGTTPYCGISRQCVECLSDSHCNDNDFCNGLETCDALLGCQAGTPLVCNDGDFCNGLETCDALLGCQAGTPLILDDSISCTIDSCDPILGVVNTPNHAVCLDTNPCNGLETCNPTNPSSDSITGCLLGIDVDCSDLDDDCNVGVCSILDGSCSSNPINNGLPCNSGSGTCDASGNCVLVTSDFIPVTDCMQLNQASTEYRLSNDIIVSGRPCLKR